MTWSAVDHLLEKEDKRLIEEGKKPKNNVVPFPRPEGVVPVKNLDLDDYEALSSSIGFYPAALLEKQILNFLNQEGIKIYNCQDVFTYMAEMATKAEKQFYWRPLRQVDLDQMAHKSYRIPSKLHKKKWHGGADPKEIRPYNKAVPERILLDVKKIHDRFGDRAEFFVSDYRVPNPDPFIMLSTLGMSHIVFGVWDEPYFLENRGEETAGDSDD